MALVRGSAGSQAKKMLQIAGREGLEIISISTGLFDQLK
jgi:hypothetical protein